MVGIIIQARMGSTRLPGKILKDFEGKTLLGHIIYRLEQKIMSGTEIVIATSTLAADDLVQKFCEVEGVKCFRGDEQNVLSRYYECARQNHYEHIVRMTGDNPFPDIEELNRLITYHLDNNMDFSENFSVLPLGVGMEIFSYEALKDSLMNASLPKHFEHADEYILDHKQEYRFGTLGTIEEKNSPSVRLTVDTQRDYERACYILKNAGTEYVTTETAITLGKEFDKNINEEGKN